MELDLRSEVRETREKAHRRFNLCLSQYLCSLCSMSLYPSMLTGFRRDNMAARLYEPGAVLSSSLSGMVNLPFYYEGFSP